MKFAYTTVASILHDSVSRAAILSSYSGALDGAGGVLVDKEGLAGLPRGVPLFLFVLTGGTEREALELLAARPGTASEPVRLIAHPLQNSLPAALEILAKVNGDGGEGRVFFMNGAKDSKTLADIEKAAALALAMGSLQGARLGRIGESSDWLVASSHGAEALRGAWGVELDEIPIRVLHDYVASEGMPSDGPEFEFFRQAAEVREPTAVDISKAVAVYRAMRRLVAERSLDALTVRCFDLVLDERTTGCFALSRLNDEGTVAGCEGDVPSALALLWAKRVTGALGWMANPARIDAAGGRLLLAHCTVPRSLVGDYTVRSHFESSLGVAISGAFASGPITLVRLGGTGLDKLWSAEGEIVASQAADGLCRTQIECRVPQASLESVLSQPLGNHIVVVPGRHQADLAESFRAVGRRLAGSKAR